MQNIVIVTRPCETKAEIQFAFDQLEKYGMKPYWKSAVIHTHSHKAMKYTDGWEVARPAVPGDPAEIISPMVE